MSGNTSSLNNLKSKITQNKQSSNLILAHVFQLQDPPPSFIGIYFSDISQFTILECKYFAYSKLEDFPFSN